MAWLVQPTRFDRVLPTVFEGGNGKIVGNFAIFLVASAIFLTTITNVETNVSKTLLFKKTDRKCGSAPWSMIMEKAESKNKQPTTGFDSRRVST